MRIDKYLKKLLCQAPPQVIYKMLRKNFAKTMNTNQIKKEIQQYGKKNRN